MSRAGAEQKTIFITGAGSGIGRAVAKLFAERGYFVGLADVNAQGIAETAAMLPANQSMQTAFDVRDRDGWKRGLDAFAQTTNNRLHVLFNNAGIARGGWFEDVAPEDSDLVVDINLKGVINGVYAALPLLKQTPGSRIVNTASVAGIYGAPRLAVYAATKFGVRGLTEALDAEFDRFGIRVTSLMPWFVDTAILDTNFNRGSNQNARDALKAGGTPIYPVSIAAERAWDAAHGKDIHYTAGEMAARTRFMARFMPGALRNYFKKTTRAG